MITEDRAKAQGIFIPNWWIAILLIPAFGAIIWVAMTLTEIKTQQAAAAQMWDLRLRTIERDVKLNDEHMRQLENRTSRIEGKRGIQPIEPEQQ